MQKYKIPIKKLKISIRSIRYIIFQNLKIKCEVKYQSDTKLEETSTKKKKKKRKQ